MLRYHWTLPGPGNADRAPPAAEPDFRPVAAAESTGRRAAGSRGHWFGRCGALVKSVPNRLQSTAPAPATSPRTAGGGAIAGQRLGQPARHQVAVGLSTMSMIDDHDAAISRSRSWHFARSLGRFRLFLVTVCSRLPRLGGIYRVLTSMTVVIGRSPATATTLRSIARPAARRYGAP